MTQIEGLCIASGFLWATAGLGGVFELFNMRRLAALAMLCVLTGFTAVVFQHDGQYVGSSVERVYHADANCERATYQKAYEVSFASAAEAARAGWKPCMKCNQTQDQHLVMARGD